MLTKQNCFLNRKREPEIINHISKIADLLKKLNINSVLLVTDRQLREFGVTASLEESLKQHSIKCAVYDGTSPNPLALYLFSEGKNHIREASERFSYGGDCINDTIIHLATSEMGFCGLGESGMGYYHGKDGFDAFSHIKSIVDKKTWLDLPMRYLPYEKAYEKLLRFYLQ